MTAYMPLMISLLSVLAFLLLASQLMMRFSYRCRMKERYDYLSMFPFEGYQIRSANGRHAIMLLILSVLSFAAAFMFPLFIKEAFAFVPGRDVMLAVFGGLLAVSIGILSLSDCYSMRRHLLTFIIMAILEMVTSIVVGFTFLDYKDTHGNVALAFAIAGFALAAFGALVVLNPKLSDWAKLKKVGEGEAATFVRPRPFLLPFTEWILIFVSYLLPILLVVGLYLVGLQA